MSRKDIDIGAEGNDGTGDSIRESFRKVNENFRELYAVFGQGGRIRFTTLEDTPEALTPNTIPFVSQDGTFLSLLELESEDGTVTFDFTSENGKLIISTGFKRISDDEIPDLGGPLDARGTPTEITPIILEDYSVSQDAVSDAIASLNSRQAQRNTDISISNLAIPKGYADNNYVRKNAPHRINSEPSSVSQYSLEIEGYSQDQLIIQQHGLTRENNGDPYIFNSLIENPPNLSNNQVYYVRYLDDNRILLFEEREDAIVFNDSIALDNNVTIAYDIREDDRHTLIDADFDVALQGNWLKSEALPRESVVRRQGDQMAGPLYVDDHPGELSTVNSEAFSEELRAASKLYVDSATFISTENLYVSLSGDDSMTGVPLGKEGSSRAYAFRTIRKAAEKAEEIIKTSEFEAGPYFQTITFDNGNENSTLISSEIVDEVNVQERLLLERNTTLLVEEGINYLRKNYQDVQLPDSFYQQKIREIIQSIYQDINRSISANTLTRTSAESFYADIDGRRAITLYKSATDGLIKFLRDYSKNILQGQLYAQKDISSISLTEIGTARVITETSHGYVDQDQVIFFNITGMTDINQQTAYVRVIDSNTLELYENRELSLPWDISGYNPFVDGVLGLIYQERVDQFESVRIVPDYPQELLSNFEIPISAYQNGNLFIPGHGFSSIVDGTAVEFNSTNSDPAGLSSSQVYHIAYANDNELEVYNNEIDARNKENKINVVGVISQNDTHTIQDIGADTINREIDVRFDLIDNILTNGIDAGTDNIYGNNKKIVIENGPDNFVDQAQKGNTDLLPGKILVGNESGAQGRIVKVVTGDSNSNNKDSIEVIQLNTAEFIEGETLRYGNIVKKKQVTINVESGIYEEDFPIRLYANVSLNGDEFRRVIIRPKKRASQSKWANIYYYQELEFDDIQILEKRHSKINQVGFPASSDIQVDDTDWMQVGETVKFTGQQLIGNNLDKETVYTITEVDVQNSKIKVQSPDSTVVTFNEQVGTMYVYKSNVSPFLNQTNQIQGYFGRHYLVDETKDLDVGPTDFVANLGDHASAAEAIELNITFFISEALAYIDENIGQATESSNIWFNFSFDQRLYLSIFNTFLTNLSQDLIAGGFSNTLESQSVFYQRLQTSEYEQVAEVLDHLKTVIDNTLKKLTIEQKSDARQDINFDDISNSTISIVERLIVVLEHIFNINYNPPKQNDGQGVDAFMMDDATIIRNVTVQGHGGFMVVLDPEGQILTKSPYIQTGSSFSKSDNAKIFRGGMYIDAFVGNIPAIITNVITEPGASGSFQLEIKSNEGQGLTVREPRLPCPFYLNGNRYQVTAISNYDSSEGTATIFLSAGSNPDTSGEGQGYQGTTGEEIFLQTAGNRSMLGNDFTQINDLGYGLVTNNGSVSEMVSMFTYYCNAAYYAKNGSEIRSLNGSNGYGNFGLIAEGADPNEIPDQVFLDESMVQPCRTVSTAEFSNSEEDPFITVSDCVFVPKNNGIITIDHGASIGVLNYKISEVQNLSDKDSDGDLFESGDEQDLNAQVDPIVYRLSIVAESENPNDFFPSLRADIADGTLVDYRDGNTIHFNGIENTDRLTTRPSTAINFDESDQVTYRSISFTTQNSINQPLGSNIVSATTGDNYNYISLEVDLDNIDDGFGSAAGDTRIAINSRSLPNQQIIDQLLLDKAGNSPEDPGYLGAGKVFSFKGKTHQIVDVQDDSSFIFIEFIDVSDILSGSSPGLSEGIPTDYKRIIFAGLPENSTAEITTSISVLRATGHDFTQIGTGGFNQSNYPNVIFGEPVVDLPEDNSYTDAPAATNAQVWERRKGRVFYVSTDQDGFFRVGKYFSVDQATGDITFAGEIGLTGANSLGFTRGVTVNEFSSDDSFTDRSSRAVPTERATANFIDRILGFNATENAVNQNRIGPGFLPLNGSVPFENNLNLGGFNITNLDNPGTDGTAAVNKNYVDNLTELYDNFENLRNTTIFSEQQNSLVAISGYQKIIVEVVGNVSLWSAGTTIRNTDPIIGAEPTKTGTIIDIETITDFIYGVVQTIVYQPITGEFTTGDIIYSVSSSNTEIVDGPYIEYNTVEENDNSAIEISINRDALSSTIDLQIKNGTITNADVNSAAQISQSKLTMEKAGVFVENDASSGWSGSKSQEDLGLATFSNENFETNQGFVRIKDNGIVFAEIQKIPGTSVIGNPTDTESTVTSVTFSEIVNKGFGIQDSDFSNEIVPQLQGFPGDALIRLQENDGTGNAVYGFTTVAESVASNTLARRDENGFIDARGYKIDSTNIITVGEDRLRFLTPQGATILTAQGASSSALVTQIPGNVAIGQIEQTQEGEFQSGSGVGEDGFSGNGWIASPWIYTSFIEAGTERDNQSTGISLGKSTGFSNAADKVISLITNGTEQLTVTTDTTTIDGNVILGSDNSKTIEINAKLASNWLPNLNEVYNLGANNSRFNTMYAKTFNGTATEARYADLAELYLADADYDPGTVLVFGGEFEVTETNVKTDTRIAGVVSQKPAHLMNSGLEGDYVAAVALQGRVPCKVLGKVSKGDLLVSSAVLGYAIASANPKIGSVIGKSLEDKSTDGKDIIEIVVGRV